MKRLLILLLGMLCTAAAEAQTHVTETFDGTSGLEWTEYSSKKGSAQPKDGGFELQSKNILSTVSTSVAFPVDVSVDFTLRSTVVLPKFDKQTPFGLFFDDAQTGTKTLLLFSPQKFGCVRYLNFDPENPSDKTMLTMLLTFTGKKFSQITPIGAETLDIKLKEGKKVRLNLEIKYQDGQYRIAVNDMPLCDVAGGPMQTPALGFCVCGTMFIESFSVEQDAGRE